MAAHQAAANDGKHPPMATISLYQTLHTFRTVSRLVCCSSQALIFEVECLHKQIKLSNLKQRFKSRCASHTHTQTTHTNTQTLEQAREARIKRKKRRGGWASQDSTADTAVGTAGDAKSDAEASAIKEGAEPRVRGERRILARHSDAEQVSCCFEK